MPTGTGHGAESGDVASEVGRTIRARMGYHRVSMVELGRRTGIPRSTLANQIDSGRITVDNLIAIGNALGVAPAELLPDSTFKASA